MWQNLPMVWKAALALLGAAGFGGVAVLGINGVRDNEPSDVQVLTTRVTALDSALADFRLSTMLRFEEVAVSAAESLRVGRETRCIVLADIEGKPPEQIMRECLQ